jgi:hypothetical protein
MRGFHKSLYKYPLKARDKLGNIVVERYLSYLYLSVLPMFRYVILSYHAASANGERVFDQMFLNLVGNIFAFREATFVFAIKANVSRYGRQGNIWANIKNHEYFRDNVSYNVSFNVSLV